MTETERERFDSLLEEILAGVPRSLLDLLDRAPLLVEDHPAPELLAELGLDPDDRSLCGLYTGTALTDRSFEEDVQLPEHIHLFREGILECAGGWSAWVDDEGERWGGADRVRDEIRITLLHEIGHHFGLDEDDLERLGYA